MTIQKTPTWVTVVIALISLLGVFVGVSLYVSPATNLPGVDLAAKGSLFLVQMWAARQLAIAGVMGYGVIRKSPGIMRTGLLIYCVMNVQDAAIGFLKGDLSLGIGATVFMVLTGFMSTRVK